MQSANSQIAVFNKEGKQIATKPRSEVDKHKDILKSAITVVLNDQLKILMVKAKDSLWPEKWGGSCAGLVRDKESTLEAAKRTLQRELNIPQKPTFLKEAYYEFKDANEDIKRHLALYYIKTNDANPNKDDFIQSKWASLDEIETLIENNQCMPTFTVAFRELQRHDCF